MEVCTPPETKVQQQNGDGEQQSSLNSQILSVFVFVSHHRGIQTFANTGLHHYATCTAHHLTKSAMIDEQSCW